MKTEINEKKDYSNLIVIGLVILIIIVIIYLFLKNDKPKEIIYNLSLIGDTYISINQNEEYIDPGFVATDQDGVNANNMVIVTGNVNVSIPGIYEVIYQIGDKLLKRIIEVKEVIIDKELKLEITKNISEITNQDIILDIRITGDTFSYLIMPNGDKVENETSSFTVTDNGTYEFSAYNSFNDEFKEKIVIDNIDKIKPTGTCEATINNNNSSIKVNGMDNNKLIYSYYDNDNLLNNGESNTYITPGKTSKNISVLLKDIAGNEEKTTCQIIDNTYFEQVLPTSFNDVIFKAETEKLKVVVDKKSSYFLSYIWVRDAYSQLNKFNSPEYGVRLYRPGKLMDLASNQYNLYDKVMLGFNASGFYLKGTYDADSVSRYSAFDRTSVGTIVITDGKVVRNAYTKAYKTWYTLGVNKENKMVIFEDLKASSEEELARKKVWADTVINSGIRNTFTFAAPIIQNGQETNITTSMPKGNDTRKGLQLICQINDNNFMLFTSTNATRNTGIKEFLSMGCQTAMNLDGGGSVALLYKEKNSNEIKTIVGNGRDLPEVGYFTE